MAQSDVRADGWEAGGGRYGAVPEDDSDVQAAGWQEESQGWQSAGAHHAGQVQSFSELCRHHLFRQKLDDILW